MSASASASLPESAIPAQTAPAQMAPAQTAPAQPAAAATTRSGKPKSADAKASDTAGTANGALAVAPLIASNLPTPATSAGTAQADSGSTGANGSNLALAPAAIADGPPAHAGAAAAVTAALAAARQPPAAAALAAPDDSPHPDVAPETDAAPAASITAPAHAALASALSAATRIEGGPPASASASAGAPPVTGSLTATNAAWSAPPAVATSTSAATQGPATPALTLHSDVASPGWANELGTRLHWMANAGVGSASLRLTPEQLGPVEVRISMHQSSASVWFTAAQPETRAALEQALPQLKDLFAAQGLNLAQAGVSDQSARGAPREALPASVGPRAGAALELNATPVTSAPRLRQGLIDTYA